MIHRAATAASFVSVQEYETGVRSLLANKFVWPSSLWSAAKPLQDLGAIVDVRRLADLAASINAQNEIIFTLLSKEYIQTGLNWINAMRRLGRQNFLIIAGDQFTSEQLDERGISSVRAEIDESGFDPCYMSHDGFSAKGLAMIALKFPVMSFLVRSGYSVVFSDVDAMWLHDPMTHVRGADIAFQRVVYHPAPVAALWGFTACTGFVFFSHNNKNIAFLDQCVTEQRSFRCDQVAMNLALLEGQPEWHCDNADWMPPADGVQHDRRHLEAAFARCVGSPIKGKLRQGGLQVLALPHDKFWRHYWVASPITGMTICHPNSPKNDLEKMKIFDALGLRFLPAV